MLPLELKEFMHNIKDHDYDICGQYKVDKSEADKVIKQLERLDKIFVNADDIKPDDEIFKDDYSDKNTQNGWIMCEDRLPNINEWVLCHCQASVKEILRWTEDGWYKDDNQCYMESFVIAWQPLPKWEVEEC